MNKKSLVLIATYFSLSFYAFSMEEITLNQDPENIQDLSHEKLVDKLTNIVAERIIAPVFTRTYRQNFFDIINNTVKEIYYTPIYYYFNKMSSAQLIDLCHYYENPRIFLLTNEILPTLINLPKYQKEYAQSLQDNPLGSDFPDDRIGKMCKKLQLDITKETAEKLNISFENTHNILYLFYQDITSRYQNELNLWDHLESSYPTLNSDLNIVIEEYMPICTRKIDFLIRGLSQK